MRAKTLGICADTEEGGRGCGPPLKNHKNIGFCRYTGPDPLKNLKATKPPFNSWPSSARQQNAIKWRYAGGPIMASFLLYIAIAIVLILSPLIIQKNNNLATLSKLDPCDKTFWIHACGQCSLRHNKEQLS